MRKVTNALALAVCVLLLTSCGDQEASFDGAVMGDPAAAPSAEPGEEPSEDPSDDPSEDPSEEPSEDPSEDPSDEPSEDPSTDPGVDDPGADPNLTLPDVAAAKGKTVQRKGYSFRGPQSWVLKGKDPTSFDVEPKTYNGESMHVFIIENTSYTDARDMAKTQTDDSETKYGFRKFGGHEWSFSSRLSDPASGRRMYFVETAHKKTAYFLTFWGDPDDPNSALRNLASIMQTWKFQ